MLQRLHSARFSGFAFVSSEASREQLRRTLSSASVLHNRTTVYFGDSMLTVRAAPALNGCDVMIIDHHPIDNLGSAASFMSRLTRGAESASGSLSAGVCDWK